MCCSEQNTRVCRESTATHAGQQVGAEGPHTPPPGTPAPRSPPRGGALLTQRRREPRARQPAEAASATREGQPLRLAVRVSPRPQRQRRRDSSHMKGRWRERGRREPGASGLIAGWSTPADVFPGPKPGQPLPLHGGSFTLGP